MTVGALGTVPATTMSRRGSPVPRSPVSASVVVFGHGDARVEDEREDEEGENATKRGERPMKRREHGKKVSSRPSSASSSGRTPERQRV